MANKKGSIRVNVNDIVGKHLGKYCVVSYFGFHYTDTKGGQKLRHLYNCATADEPGVIKVIQRGQLLRERLRKQWPCAWPFK